MEAFGRAFAAADGMYRDEFRQWDLTLADDSTDITDSTDGAAHD